LSTLLEFFGKGFVIDESPWVIELVVPRPLEIAHRRDQIVQLFVPDEGEKGGIDAGGVGAVGGVVVFFSSP
jgi:hypothetical protein